MRDMHCDSNAALCIGGRLAELPDETLVESAFATELDEQLMLSDAIHWVDIAHVVSLIKISILKNKEGANLLNALLKLQASTSNFIPTPSNGDLFTNREKWLSEFSNAVGWLCAGRTRREATTVAYHITIRSYLLDLSEELSTLVKAILKQASQYKSALMPDYTYLQAGQPTTFGHYLLSFVFMILRDCERLITHFERVNFCPAGCGGINGSSLQINRDELAALLGFSRPVMHTRDAMWQADISIETTFILTSILTTLDRLSEDLLCFATKEFDYIELHDSYSRASKSMPQKKNPYGLSYIRALANKLIGVHVMVTTMQRTPTGQVDNRLFVYGEVPKALSKSTEAVSLFKKIIESLQFKSSNAKNRVQESFILATDLAELISIENNLDYRTSHHLVGFIVRTFSQADKNLIELTNRDLDNAANEILGHTFQWSNQIFELLKSPQSALERKCGLGGTSKQRILEMNQYCQKEVNRFEIWIKDTRNGLNEAEHRLLEQTHALIKQ